VDVPLSTSTALATRDDQLLAAQITGGVDTHLDVHVVAALDELGALAGVESFPTTPVGYRALLGWLGSHGEVVVVGVEGTGSYGAGLARHLHRERVAMVEVDRPNRQRRRRQGKTDPHDAVTPLGPPRAVTRWA
jgi:transposase